MSASLNTYGEVSVHKTVDWEVIIRDFPHSDNPGGICKVVEIVCTDNRGEKISINFFDSVISDLNRAIEKAMFADKKDWSKEDIITESDVGYVI